MLEGEQFERVEDRAAAIQAALELARPGDLVLTAGKGHERSMCLGTVEYPWSEHQAMRDGLASLGYR